MSEQRPEMGVTNSRSQPGGLPEGSFTVQPGGSANNPSLSKEAPAEFVVRVVHSSTGRVFSPFIVQAADEAAARKMCRRNYLMVESVERYVPKEGKEKPRTLTYGPPISDKDFESDYGGRPADRSERTKVEGALVRGTLMGVGWFFCGSLGGLLGWWVGGADEQ
jgi:hypothetical protein